MSMSDRELLELAAKAAGIEWSVSRDSVSGWLLATTIEQFDDYGDSYLVENKIWWPLKDDGDALRLAVKLNFDVCINGETVFVRDFDCNETELMLFDDPMAATRRAIVRAAAEIGRGMP